MAAARRFLAVAALLGAAASAEVDGFIASGLCESLAAVNGVTFAKQGMTARNSPYYKGTTAAGEVWWIYHDDDCAASDDGTPKWILGNSVLHPDRQVDLDHDNRCYYRAYIESAGLGIESPPLHSTWKMVCNYVWTHRDLTLSEITSTATSTSSTATATVTDSTTVSTTSTTIATEEDPSDGSPTSASAEATTTSVAGATTTTGVAPEALRLAGACATKGFLNGMFFVLQGTTAIGAPYYKAAGAEEYIYYDEDCSGSGGNDPRWIIDSDRPEVSRRTDLDQDGKCDYHARLTAGDWESVPTTGTWIMYCGGQWKAILMTAATVDPSTVSEVRQTTTARAAQTTAPDSQALISGAAALWPLGVPLTLAAFLW